MTDIPYGYCQCGCGERTSLHRQTDTKRGMVKGEPARFIRGHHVRVLPPTKYKPDRYTVESRGYETPCWIWQLYVSAKGYGMEWDSGRGQMNFAHRLAYERAFGPIPPGREIDHRCRQRACVNPDHLDIVDHETNLARGNPGNVRLLARTEQRVRELLALGLSQNEIARACRVSQTAVSRIARGITPEDRRRQ